METWQLQDAKNKFSALFERALHKGPQRVTRHGKTAVVVMSEEEYNASQGKKRPEKNFIEFLLAMPKLPGDDEDLFVRTNGTMRDVDFE